MIYISNSKSNINSNSNIHNKKIRLEKNQQHGGKKCSDSNKGKVSTIIILKVRYQQK